jgi:hypothetical protein
MTSHVDLIIRVNEGFVLFDVIRDFKSYLSIQMKKTISENRSENRQEWML